MDNTTVFTKTAKGITQVNQRSASLSKDLMKILKLVDGKSTFAQILDKAELDKPVLEKAMNTLIRDGFARVFETRKQADPFGEDDFDFTAPGKLPGQTQRVVAAAALDISELSRQQERAESDKKARENAHVAAREKAKQQAEARARAEAEAKAKAEAETRAMEQARRAKEASERARAELDARAREEEARRQALATQQAKLAAEQKAKEEEEARRLAELRAKAQAEADARARAELEAKVRAEEARKIKEAEEHARAAAAERKKEEAERQRGAEARAKAEAEARALAEARSRAEAEAAALAKARAEAEAAARRHAQEAVASEQELKARLKEEIEERIRGEMETLLREEIEEKAQSELRAQIMEEARLAAKAELEERLQVEREALKKAELEMRTEAERAARERADKEAKLRAEAEARAVAESAAREKAEEEARRLRRLEAQAREQAEAAAREKAETATLAARERAESAARLDAERKAKIEAEARAMVEAEERERREKELAGRIDTERRAREEAEKRARIEARARETVEETTREKVKAEIEGDMTRRAELEGKAQAKAYMRAKEQAELDEDARIRGEQERRAREIADVLRTKVEPDAEESATPVRRRPRKKVKWVRNIAVSLAAILVIGVGLLHVVPLRGFANKLEKGIGGWLHEEVSISNLKFSLVPTPHFKIEGFTVGKALDAKATHGRVFVDIAALAGDRVVVNKLELENVSIAGEAPRRILSWGAVQGKAAAAEVEVVRLTNVKLDVKPELRPFDATLAFARNGAFRNASLSGEGKWTATISPRESNYEVSFSARSWALPIGAPVPVSDVSAKGVLTANDLTFSEFEADVLEGKVNGTLKVSWGPTIRLASDLSLARVRADQLVGAFTPDIAVTGKVEGNFAVSAEAPTLAEILAAPRIQGKFRLSDGSVSNADLVAAMQSPDAAGRAGVTKFAELTGEFLTGDGRASYRSLNLQGGVLRGGGGIDIAPNGALSGRLSVEIRSNVAQDRGAFSVSGTVAKPILRRGG
ncbi:MAG: AsmA-like C-terminal region-containing protein [Burkholderiales bacterium]